MDFFRSIGITETVFQFMLVNAILVMGDGDVTDFLLWAALGGVVIGALGPTVGWGRWTTHLIGACFAALLTPLLVGWVLIPEGADAGILFQRTSLSAVNAWIDLVVNQDLSTFEFGHHLLVLGLLVATLALSLGLVLGFVAAGRETYQIYRRYQQEEESGE